MDVLSIVLLTLVVALLAGALAWYGPRRRHWQTHPEAPGGRPGSEDGEGSPDEGSDT